MIPIRIFPRYLSGYFLVADYAVASTRSGGL